MVAVPEGMMWPGSWPEAWSAQVACRAAKG